MLKRILIIIFGSFLFCLFASGCSTAPEPRVIAERVFSGDRLSAILTTYPGDPSELTISSCRASEDTVGDIQREIITIEGRPGWRFNCIAPNDAEELTLHITVLHAGRRFRVEIPFRRRKTYIARHGRNVLRWTTRRERIHDLGPVDVSLTRNP